MIITFWWCNIQAHVPFRWYDIQACMLHFDMTSSARLSHNNWWLCMVFLSIKDSPIWRMHTNFDKENFDVKLALWSLERLYSSLADFSSLSTTLKSWINRSFGSCIWHIFPKTQFRTHAHLVCVIAITGEHRHKYNKLLTNYLFPLFFGTSCF